MRIRYDAFLFRSQRRVIRLRAGIFPLQFKKSTLFESAPIALTTFNLANVNFPPRSLSLSSGERSGSSVFAKQISQKRSASSIACLHGIANDANQVVGNARSIMVSLKQHVRLASDFYLLTATEKTYGQKNLNT
jgi:hypothetical protein